MNSQRKPQLPLSHEIEALILSIWGRGISLLKDRNTRLTDEKFDDYVLYINAVINAQFTQIAKERNTALTAEQLTQLKNYFCQQMLSYLQKNDWQKESYRYQEESKALGIKLQLISYLKNVLHPKTQENKKPTQISHPQPTAVSFQRHFLKNQSDNYIPVSLAAFIPEYVKEKNIEPSSVADAKQKVNGYFDAQIQKLDKKQKSTELTAQQEGLRKARDIILTNLDTAIELPLWKNVKEKLEQQLAHLVSPNNLARTSRTQNITSIRQQLADIDSQHLPDNEKIKLLSETLVAEYRQIIRSRGGMESFFGGGSNLASRLRTFCKENLYFTLPQKLGKGEKLQLDGTDNIIIQPKYHLMAYGAEAVNATVNDRLQLFKEIEKIICQNADWKNQSKLADKPTGIAIIHGFIGIHTETNDISEILGKIKKQCANRLQETSHSRSDTTHAFYKALSVVDITDKRSMTTAIKHLENIGKQLKQHTQALRSQLQYGNFRY